MIKCNVTVIGTVSREGRIMTDNSGRSFIAFGLQTVLQAKSGINKTLDISVAGTTSLKESITNCITI